MKHQLATTLSKLHFRVPSLLTEFHVPGVSYTVYEKDNVYPFSAGISGAQINHKVDEETLFHACSMSKLVTSVMVLKLVELGVLALDLPVNHYLKDWMLRFCSELGESIAGKPANQVTLIHLLNHTSGIEDQNDAFGPLKEGDDIPSIMDIVLGKPVITPKKLH